MHASGQVSVTLSHRQLANLANVCVASTEVCAFVAISGWSRGLICSEHTMVFATVGACLFDTDVPGYPQI